MRLNEVVYIYVCFFYMFSLYTLKGRIVLSAKIEACMPLCRLTGVKTNVDLKK